MEVKNPWTTINQKTVYENPWIKVSHREVLNPAGNKGIYGLVHFKNRSVGIVPLDEAGNTWLVGQYRYPLDIYSWEIPEGGCPSGEEMLDAAKRELKEETGLIANSWEKLLDFHTSNSVTDEFGQAFIARDLIAGKAEPEETEDLHIKKLPFMEAFQMVMRNEITDSMSVAAILKTHLRFFSENS